ncbi:DUF2306 domain-containing protein [Mycolicibacterium sp. BiH015]|uniref:DUF2306 domain-containing protein n=1 Tax=Mycolicibacterium sp. BiH015 TaxID=3018808 RepID=UPI0022E77454|nr:DUF2306 domain-containing protein [Mycolicibacterium sp. BiH015]MDA2889987.1 DUF2306 domain-containing protein [Mycolicibacterium sp. BiH015]
MTEKSTAPTSRSVRSRRHIPWLAVLLTSLAVAVFSPSQYFAGTLGTLAERGVGLAGTYAERPTLIQYVFYIHIVSAGVALLIGGFQFSRRLRQRSRRAHRWIGRSYVAAVSVGAASGLVMAFFSSVGFTGFFGFGTLAALWLWTTYRGYRSAREGDFAEHQAWMIRSFALTYAAPTLRMWFFMLILIQMPFGVDLDVAAANAYAPVPFLCWLPNVVVAEFLIRRRGLPSLIRAGASEVARGRSPRSRTAC